MSVIEPAETYSSLSVVSVWSISGQLTDTLSVMLEANRSLKLLTIQFGVTKGASRRGEAHTGLRLL